MMDENLPFGLIFGWGQHPWHKFPMKLYQNELVDDILISRRRMLWIKAIASVFQYYCFFCCLIKPESLIETRSEISLKKTLIL